MQAETVSQVSNGTLRLKVEQPEPFQGVSVPYHTIKACPAGTYRIQLLLNQ